MELRHLQTFRVVAESGGVTRAGELLGYAQSTVTSHIQALEEEVGCPLFDRLGKKVVLTEAGRRLLPYAKEMLRLSRSALEAAVSSDQPSGTIRIGAPESLLAYRLPAILNDYKKRYPQVELVLQPGQCREMRSKLRSGEMDIAFLLDRGDSGEDLMVKKLIEEELVLVAPPGHPLSNKETVFPSDLEGETLLKTEAGCSYRDLLDQRLKAHAVHSSTEIEFWNIEAIKNCVMCGLGISYLPRMAVETELAEGKLTRLAWSHADDRVLTQLAHHKDKWLTPAMEKLIEMVEQHAKQW